MDEALDKMADLFVSLTANLLYQYLSLPQKSVHHLSEGFTVEISEQNMTLRYKYKSSAAPLLHCCTSQSRAVN